MSRPPAPAGPRFALHAPGDRGRREVEDFIRGVYAEHYGARVPAFAPQLVSLRDGEQIVAAAGYRSAAEPLFLERYLDRPVERLLAGVAGAPSRGRIVEVGHLASRRAGEGRRLILRLAQHLGELRVQWVVSTLTEELRQVFARMGVQPVALGLADPARLGAEAADWGSYYDHRPLVLAGSLPLALRRLAPRLARA
ncbi:MAG TPA: thermostable hemolysin [Methylibium sp.]|nr:thermostable hemolysin [Methylibium sp.]